MRTVEQQEKMIQQARDNQWSIAQAIVQSDLHIDDQEDLLCIIQSNNHTDAFRMYGMLDTIIRDRFMDMIEETLYGSQGDSDASNSVGCNFTQDELKMLSDAILCEIQANGTAAKLTTSPRAVTAIMEHNDRLRELNNKICSQLNAKICGSFRQWEKQKDDSCTEDKNGFRCDMCFAKPEYEIMADDRYNELPAFDLFLCSGHAKQLADSINAAFHADDFFNEIKNMEDDKE